MSGDGWTNRRRVVRFSAVVVTAALLGGASAASAEMPPDPLDPDPVEELPGGEAPSFQPPENGFDWSVPSRFGRDDNRDSIIDYHWNDLARAPEHSGPPETYAPSWVHPASFPMNFDGCPTEEEAAKSDAGEPTANLYTWVIDGQPIAPTEQRSCRFLRHEFPAQGEYPVTLTITLPDGTQAGPYSQEVYVRDLLIVSLGDSYGSGEGNPEVDQFVHDGGVGVISPAKWVDERCHRSATAGPAQAARVLEASDPKTSVTFLSFACSGATISTQWGTNPFFPYASFDPDDPANPGTGVLGPYAGAAPAPKAAKLPSQLDQLQTALALPDQPGEFRPVDALIMSAGGNDAGFGPVAAQCVLVIEECMGSLVQRRNSNEPFDLVRLDERLAQDLEELATAYDDLDEALDRLGIPVGRTYVSEYPDSTTDDAGRPCAAILDDVFHPNLLGIVLLVDLLTVIFGPHVVSLMPLLALGAVWTQTRAMAGSEVVWAGTSIAPGINAELRAAADEHGWTYVGGISDRYIGHGYCAADSYIRRAPEASWLQGPWGPAEIAGIHSATKGTLHPNLMGHRVYAEQLFPHLAAQFGVGATSSTFSFSEQVGDTVSRRGRAGWLTGRCRSGADQCTSDAAVATVEVIDGIGIKGARLQVNGVPGCPAQGVTCTAELVAPDKYRWTFVFTEERIWHLDFAVSNRRGQVNTFGRDVKVDLADPTATASPGAGRAPTGIRFDGNDGRGSGVDEISFEGLMYGSPGSTAPGQTVPVDLGGTYELRYRAVDEAGRAGPWQTQSVTLAGPTMSEAPAGVDQYCTQFHPEDSGAWNERDGLPVSLRTPRNRGVVVPARRALSIGSKATWVPAAFSHGHEDCSVSAQFSDVPLNVSAGTSGLAPGTPITLEATVHLGGAISESFDSGDRNFMTYAEMAGFFTVSGLPSDAPCEDECFTPPALQFGAEAERQTYGQRGLEVAAYREYAYNIQSNREAGDSVQVRQDIPGCIWPCSLAMPGAPSPTAPLRFPAETLTITFDTYVGARHLIDGMASGFTQAYSDGRTEVSANADFTPVLELRPAAGFEGVELVYGDDADDPPAPEAPTVAMTDPINATAQTAVVVSGTGEEGATATITVNDANPATPPVEASDVVDSTGYSATVDVSPLDDGDVTATVTLTNEGGTGPAATASATKDTQAPATTATLTPPPGPGGENIGDVTVILRSTDLGTGVDHITYRATGAQPIAQTTVPGGEVTVDITAEGEVTLTYFATDGAGNVEEPRTVTVRIDRPPSVRVADARVAEGRGSDSRRELVTANVTVSLSEVSDEDVTVGFRTADGTAIAGDDYQATSGRLTIPAGSTSAAISVTVLGDYRVEPDEELSVVLAAPVGATLGDAEATLTVLNDDQSCGNTIARLLDRIRALLTGGYFVCQ